MQFETQDMANRKTAVTTRKPRKIVERNIALLGQWTKYLIAHPQVLDSLPEKFELVILPDDDEPVRRYNLDLLSIYGSESKPVVFVRLKSSKQADFQKMLPSIYVPLPLAV